MLWLLKPVKHSEKKSNSNFIDMNIRAVNARLAALLASNELDFRIAR